MIIKLFSFWVHPGPLGAPIPLEWRQGQDSGSCIPAWHGCSSWQLPEFVCDGAGPCLLPSHTGRVSPVPRWGEGGGRFSGTRWPRARGLCLVSGYLKAALMLTWTPFTINGASQPFRVLVALKLPLIGSKAGSGYGEMHRTNSRSPFTAEVISEQTASLKIILCFSRSCLCLSQWKRFNLHFCSWFFSSLSIDVNAPLLLVLFLCRFLYQNKAHFIKRINSGFSPHPRVLNQSTEVGLSIF